MSPSQRRSHRRMGDPNHIGSQGSSHQVNGSVEVHQYPQQTTAPSSGQRPGTHGHAYYDHPNASRSLRNIQNPNGLHQHQQREYVEVYRLQRPDSSSLNSIVNNPLLDFIPSSPRRYGSARNPSNGHQGSMNRPQSPRSPSQPLFPATSLSSTPYRGTPSQLTRARLEQHQLLGRRANPLRRRSREGPHAGPYDAIGSIRQDGQVYAQYESYGQPAMHDNDSEDDDHDDHDDQQQQHNILH